MCILLTLLHGKCPVLSGFRFTVVPPKYVFLYFLWASSVKFVSQDRTDLTVDRRIDCRRKVIDNRTERMCSLLKPLHRKCILRFFVMVFQKFFYLKPNGIQTITVDFVKKIAACAVIIYWGYVNNTFLFFFSISL